MLTTQLTHLWPLTALLAGLLAGAINVVVGAGSLVSFPLLLLAGFPPVTANIANTVGLVPASASGVWVYRPELARRRRFVARLMPASALGGLVGAVLLLELPPGVFSRVVPWLVVLGTILVALGPTIRARVGGREARERPDLRTAAVPEGYATRRRELVALVGALLLGCYGGYFGAAQGILLVGLLGVVAELDMQELNAVKNLAVLVVNLVAAITFCCVPGHQVDWALAACVALGSACGGVLGGRVARRLSPTVLRACVVVVGLATGLVMLLR